MDEIKTYTDVIDDSLSEEEKKYRSDKEQEQKKHDFGYNAPALSQEEPRSLSEHAADALTRTSPDEQRNLDNWLDGNYKSWYDFKNQAQQEKIVREHPIEAVTINGVTYTRHTPLHELKELSYMLIDEMPADRLPAESAKALFNWITTKERYGDDIYKHRETSQQKNMQRERIVAERKDIGVSQIQDRLDQRKLVNDRLRRQIQEIQGHSRETVDGEYTEIWGADKSAIAAGPMGAASGGLRPVGPSQFFKIVQKQLNDVAFQASLQDEAKARHAAALDMAEVKKLQAGSMGSWTESSIDKEISKLGKESIYKEVSTTEVAQSKAELRALRHSEYMRDPNRDNRELDEYQLPGPGAGMPGAFGVF